VKRKTNYVLCRPNGGLSDNLVTIARCLAYAQRTNRVLVVDGRNSHFAKDYSRVFRWASPSVHMLRLPASLARDMDKWTCFRPEITGRVSNYETRTLLHPKISTLEYRIIIDNKSDVILNFDFDADYSEQVLIYDNHSAGVMSPIDGLRELKLRWTWKIRVWWRLRRLRRREYVGLHVRNTDLKSDVQATFDLVREKVSGKTLVVCSDNQSVLDMANDFFTDAHVVTPSHIGNRGGKPYQLPFIEGRRASMKLTLDTLVDLMAMGLARELFVARVVNRCDEVSGFSHLCQSLQREQQVVTQLTGINFGVR